MKSDIRTSGRADSSARSAPGFPTYACSVPETRRSHLAARLATGLTAQPAPPLATRIGVAIERFQDRLRTDFQSSGLACRSTFYLGTRDLPGTR